MSADTPEFSSLRPRRSSSAWISSCLAVFISTVSFAIDPSAWASYRQHFILPDGRVVDTANAGISHSESQGYGLLLAEACGDRETFDQVLAWTCQHLRVREDALFAWRWKPGVGVDDSNNATDGDLLIAWAMERGARRWNNSVLHEQAQVVAHAVRTKLIRRSPFGLLLLPADHGFEHDGAVVVNLSYWIFPAIPMLAEIDPSEDWRELEKSGLALCDKGRFGSWQLPPDWLQVKEDALTLPDNFAAVFGYNAVRVPLHLRWSGHADHPCVEACNRYTELAASTGTLHASIDLKTGIPDSDPAPPGVQAILRLPAPPEQNVGAKESYFSASLALLSTLAAEETSIAHTGNTTDRSPQ